MRPIGRRRPAVLSPLHGTADPGNGGGTGDGCGSLLRTGFGSPRTRLSSCVRDRSGAGGSDGLVGGFETVRAGGGGGLSVDEFGIEPSRGNGQRGISSGHLLSPGTSDRCHPSG